jgi:uncharacterized protein YkwD
MSNLALRQGLLVLLILVLAQAITYLPNVVSLIKNRPKNPPISTNTALKNDSSANQIKGVEADQNPEINKEQFYLLINAYRKENKLSPLLAHPSLEISATSKLADMIQKKYFRHQDVQAKLTWHFLTNTGYQYKRAGENLSFGLNTPWQVLQAWIDSPEHNALLLDSTFEHMGLASDCQALSSYAGGGCIVVLHFGLK